MSEPTVTLAYRSTAEEDRLEFRVEFADDIAPAPGKGPSFKIEYHLPMRPTPRRPAKVVQTEVFSIGEYPPGSTIVREWFATAEQLYYVGKIVLVISWAPTASGEAGATSESRHEFDAGTPVNSDLEGIALTGAAPEMLKLVNAPNVKPYPVSAASTDLTDETAIKADEVLRYVCATLDAGLGAVWRSVPGLKTIGGRALCEVPLDNITEPEDLEECWAQHITECLVGTPYAGPGPNYGAGGAGVEPDRRVFRLAVRESDPAHSIIFACQQLSTMAAITRGLDDAAEEPLDASTSAAMESWALGVTTDEVILKDGAYASAKRAQDDGYLWPGVYYVRGDTRHIAFVLRALKSGQFQLLDTGALWTEPAHSSPLGYGNYDTNAATKVTCAFKELGVVPRTARLREGIARMRRARPLGLARLILLNRGDGQLYYAGPVAPMWHPTGEQNYAISRCMWSLRNHPHRDTFEARWLIDLPQHGLYQVVSASRSFDWNGPHATRPYAVLDLGSNVDGTVRMVGVWSTKAEKQADGSWKTNPYWKPGAGKASVLYDDATKGRIIRPELDALGPWRSPGDLRQWLAGHVPETMRNWGPPPQLDPVSWRLDPQPPDKEA